MKRLRDAILLVFAGIVGWDLTVLATRYLLARGGFERAKFVQPHT